MINLLQYFDLPTEWLNNAFNTANVQHAIKAALSQHMLSGITPDYDRAAVTLAIRFIASSSMSSLAA